MIQRNPRIYADFHNADANGRLRLDCAGTAEDLAQQQINLREGLLLTLYADDLDDSGQLDELEVEGVVSYSTDEQCWVADIDWSRIRHVSDTTSTGQNKLNPAGNAAISPVSDSKLSGRG